MCRKFVDKLIGFLFETEIVEEKPKVVKAEPKIIKAEPIKVEPAEIKKEEPKIKIVKQEVFIDPPKKAEPKPIVKKEPEIIPEKYEQREIISPFFGNVNKPCIETEAKKRPTMTRTKIISPIYGTQIIEEPVKNVGAINVPVCEEGLIIAQKQVVKKTKEKIVLEEKPVKETAKKKTAKKEVSEGTKTAKATKTAKTTKTVKTKKTTKKAERDENGKL